MSRKGQPKAVNRELWSFEINKNYHAKFNLLFVVLKTQTI